jgi:hypothetical protein
MVTFLSNWDSSGARSVKNASLHFRRRLQCHSPKSLQIKLRESRIESKKMIKKLWPQCQTIAIFVANFIVNKGCDLLFFYETSDLNVKQVQETEWLLRDCTLEQSVNNYFHVPASIIISLSRFKFI